MVDNRAELLQWNPNHPQMRSVDGGISGNYETQDILPEESSPLLKAIASSLERALQPGWEHHFTYYNPMAETVEKHLYGRWSPGSLFVYERQDGGLIPTLPETDKELVRQALAPEYARRAIQRDVSSADWLELPDEVHELTSPVLSTTPYILHEARISPGRVWIDGISMLQTGTMMVEIIYEDARSLAEKTRLDAAGARARARNLEKKLEELGPKAAQTGELVPTTQKLVDQV